MRCALFGMAVFVSAAAGAQPSLNLPPEAYIDPVDRQIAETGKGVPGRPAPCTLEEVKNGGRILVGRPIDKCVKMLPPQRWKGLWRVAFEGSRFCPEPARSCDSNTPGERIWLHSGPGTRGRGELYRVDFIGRRTAYKAEYGLIYDHEIIMDKAITIQLIRDARKSR